MHQTFYVCVPSESTTYTYYIKLQGCIWAFQKSGKLDVFGGIEWQKEKNDSVFCCCF